MSEFWFDHLSSALSDNGIVAYIWDCAEDRMSWTGDVYRMLGLEPEDYPRTSAQFNKMINPQQAPERLSALHDVLGRDPGHDIAASFTMTYKMRRANGAQVDVEETARVQHEPASGKRVVCGFLKQVRIAAKPLQNNEESRQQLTDNVVAAGSDLGFGNYGRHALQQKIVEWFDTYNCDQRLYGYVLSLGIDRMALFNDVLGPRYADEILEKTGLRLRQIVGQSGTVMRVDGDVYGIFFRRAPHNEMAAVAKYILNNFHNIPVQTSMGPIAVCLSIGGVTLDMARDPYAVISMAEMSMHVAKDKGRSCFVSYDEASHKAEDSRALLKSADTFLKAMKNDRLRFAFQPIMGSMNNSVSFHECLMRLIDDDGSIISAGSFIPAIEEMGLSRLVDQHALRMAMQELGMFPDLELSINVSNLSLNNQDWLRSLVAALRDRPSVARRLIIEITESAVINDPVNIKRIVSTLRDLGCRVALDDFGAGYTAFSQLKDLNVDLVKIDKSFIRNIGENHNHLFVQTLKSLASGVNIKTVGEGAETLAEAKILASDGIDYIQGYVYGFPRVERLWLPKEHTHRNISLAPEDNAGTQHAKTYEETAYDIAAWQKAHAG